MKKTIIHLVRHGEVENPQSIFYGRIPGFFLSQHGRNEVKKLGRHLSGKKISALYASPLDRTHETAHLLSKAIALDSIIHDERLIEVGTPLQGRPMAELAMFQWNFFQEEYFALGGERLEDIQNRMIEFFDEKKQEHEGQEILVVSHGDPIMVTRAHHEKEPLNITYLRGEKFVQTAHGLTFTFENEAVIVEEIRP